MEERSEPGRSASGELARSRRGTEKTVLVVDDVDGVRELLSEVLRLHGYRVLSAGDGVEALRLAEEADGPIDLLLTDVVMPRMGGPELADRFASGHPEAKVIFISGYSDEAIANHGKLQPGTVFLKKPFATRTLVRLVEESLAGAG